MILLAEISPFIFIHLKTAGLALWLTPIIPILLFRLAQAHWMDVLRHHWVCCYQLYTQHWARWVTLCGEGKRSPHNRGTQRPRVGREMQNPHLPSVTRDRPSPPPQQRTYWWLPPNTNSAECTKLVPNTGHLAENNIVPTWRSGQQSDRNSQTQNNVTQEAEAL